MNDRYDSCRRKEGAGEKEKGPKERRKYGGRERKKKKEKEKKKRYSHGHRLDRLNLLTITCDYLGSCSI